MPFVERVAYKHSLKEVPLDVPSQVCITRDNTQLQVDGILYFQVTDPMRASYGSSDYIVAITQLAQTTLRSVIGKMELDKTFEERDLINAAVVNALDEAAHELGREGAALRDQGPHPAGGHPARHAGADHRRAREARADRRQRGPAPGTDQHRHRRTRGLHRPQRRREAGRDQQGHGRGRGHHRRSRCHGRRHRKIAAAIQQPGGDQAVQLKVAEKAVDAYAQLAQKNNTMIVPGHMGEVAGLIGTAMALLKAGPDTGKTRS
jgi:regulator of protease activity HflC (stomatin/prohibitin superfamily)